MRKLYKSDLRHIRPARVGTLFLIVLGSFGCVPPKSQNPAAVNIPELPLDNRQQVAYLLDSESNPQILDPQSATESEEVFVNALFDGLAEYDRAGNTAEPSLALKWSKNENATVWTFYLRKDAQWTDGTPLTVSDFVYSWRRALTPQTIAYNAELLYCIKNASRYEQGRVKAEELGITALDDYTLQVTMEKPTAFFDKLVVKSVFRPVPKHVVEKFGEAWTKYENVAVSGAFRLDGAPSNGALAVVRNEVFWDNANTKLHKIVFYAPDSPETRGKKPIDLYRSKKISATGKLPADEIPTDEKDLISGQPISITYLNINTQIKPFDDLRVRKALNLAINREGLKETGISQSPTASFLPWFEDYENAQTTNFNPAEARRLLAAAGFPNGKNFPEVEYIYNVSDTKTATAKFVQAQLEKELGLKIILNPLSFRDFIKRRQSLDFAGLAAGAWIGDYADPNSFLEIFSTNDSATGWKDKKYDELLNEANVESNPVKRYVFLHEAEIRLTEQLPAIPLYSSSDTILCRPFIKNLTPHPAGQINWRQVYIDEELYKAGHAGPLFNNLTSVLDRKDMKTKSRKNAQKVQTSLTDTFEFFELFCGYCFLTNTQVIL